MRQFFLKDEEVRLINTLRHLSCLDRDMVAYLVSELERKTAIEPFNGDSKISVVRAIPAR